ncbi:MAG: hydrogenase nickel incorporation protein HypB [Erysipelotrichaceae bacterium]|nr:hydrogenase nickel incorporation protein HypB [Erysipelotrichaceae bacterium]
MDEVRIIEVKQSVFASNERRADLLRKQLKEKKVFLLNVMSSPGSGKTTTLTGLINRLKEEYKIGVMEADIDSDVDARTISKNTGVEAVQLHTGGMCHLDADMTRQGIESFGDWSRFDLIVLENVGNLVCPAEFDTGAVRNMCILSVPEGDDKPLKYPLMFEVSNFVLINKIDVAPYFDFDMDKCKANIAYRNPLADIFEICAKDERGLDEVADYLRKQIDEWNS